MSVNNPYDHTTIFSNVIIKTVKQSNQICVFKQSSFAATYSSFAIMVALFYNSCNNLLSDSDIFVCVYQGIKPECRERISDEAGWYVLFYLVPSPPASLWHFECKIKCCAS